MTRLGMDVDEVDRIVRQLDQQHGDLSRLVEDVGGLVERAVSGWDGPDAREFQGTWLGQYQPHLTQAAQSLAELSDTAQREALAQREVSGQ